MALLDGKQIRNSTISLDKLSGTGSVTLTGATIIAAPGSVLKTDSSNILTDNDVVNKLYVDSVAAGLDVKKSVKVIANTQSLTLSGVGMVIDGYTVSVGDRILVNAQDGSNPTASNGIYIASTGSWLRAPDSDGSPNGEVSVGNFVFVEEGIVYAHTGWVLSITDALNKDNILVGTDSQLWVQFSESTKIIDGDGLSYNGNVLNVNVGSGLTISSDAIALSDTSVIPGSYGSNSRVPIFTVDNKGRLTYASDVLINITSSQITDFTHSVVSVVSNSFYYDDSNTIDFTVNGTTISASIIPSSITPSHLKSTGNPTAGYILSVDSNGNFEWIENNVGDITAVIAGNGLTGGGTFGSVTLSVDYMTVSSQLAGNGLTANSYKIDAVVSNGLTISNGAIQISPTIAGVGLTFNAGVLSVLAGDARPVYQIGLTTSVPTGETGILLSQTPNKYSRIQVFVNGVLQRLGDGVTTEDCHFGTTTSAISLNNLSAGDQLVWNASNAGFELSPTDKIDIIYEA